MSIQALALGAAVLVLRGVPRTPLQRPARAKCHGRSGAGRRFNSGSTAIAGSLSTSIPQERRYALTRDAELFGDFLHGHSLAV